MTNKIKSLSLLALASLTTLSFGAEFGAKGKSTEKIRINGRLHAQFESINTDYSSEADPHTVNEFIMRRVYLGAKGTLENGMSGEINANFAGSKGEGKLEKAIVKYSANDALDLNFGYKKTPIGFEETTSSSKIKTVERSIATRYFTEQLALGARMTGVHANGELDGGFYYDLSLTNPKQGTVGKNTGADENVLAYSGRIGFEGSNDSFEYDLGAYAGSFSDIVKAGEEATIYGLFGDFTFGIFSLTAEVMQAGLEGVKAGGSDADALGYYIMPALEVSDNFDIVLRYANIDSDGGEMVDLGETSRRAPTGTTESFNEADAYYIGGNWYVDGNNVKVTFGYETASYETAGVNADVDSFRVRLQLLF